MSHRRYTPCALNPVFESMEARLLLDGTPLITEFMAINGSTLTDSGGVYSDWIEIHNPTEEAISLNGWHLTDDPGWLEQWTFPDVSLGAGEYLIVFASGTDDPPVAGQELHTNFVLDGSNGEYLALVKATPSPTAADVVTEYAFPPQVEDVSYGLATDYDVTSILPAGAEAATLIPTGDIGSGWQLAGYNDSGWIAGTTGVGYESTVDGWAVYNCRSTGTVGNLDDAEAVLMDPGLQATVDAENIAVINYLNTESGAHFGSDNTFPGMVMYADESNFVTYAAGIVTIPVAGQYTFGVNSDDGFRLTIYGAVCDWGGDTIDYFSPRGPGDTTGIYTFGAAGDYDIELVYYEQGGGAEVEVYAAAGSYGGWTDGVFYLVGDTAGGGLAVRSQVVAGGGGLSYQPLIGTDVEDAMLGQNASAYVRVPFTVADAGAYTALTLRMKYDDGFVAYLNGHEIGRRNAPTGTPAWNAGATGEHLDVAAIVYENITVPIAYLLTGDNVLAIHGLNNGAADTDFLIVPELAQMINLGLVPRFFTEPTPEEANGEGYVDFVADTVFDHDRGFYTAAFDLAITTATPGAAIYYTLDGSSPAADDGAVAPGAIAYTGPVHIAGTSVVRAAAFKDGWLSTNADTQTYLFLADIIHQSPNGEAPFADVLLSAAFNSGADGFTYADDLFNGTSRPAYASGTYQPAGGYSGGGLKVVLGPGPTGGATSGGWSKAFTATEEKTYQVSLRYRLVLGSGYENTEFGEAILEIDGVRYGSDLNGSLRHQIGDGNGGGDWDSGWQTVTFNVTLTAGPHTLRIGAYNNGATESTEWTNAYFDDVSILRSDWPSGTVAGQIIDYGMDPDIVNDPTWGAQLESALLSIPTMSLVTSIDSLFSAGTGIYTHAGNRGLMWERAASLELIYPDGDPDDDGGFQADAGIRIRGGYSRSGDNPKHAFRVFFRGQYGQGKLQYPLFGNEGASEFDGFDIRTAQNYSWSFGGDPANTFVRDVFSRDMQREMGQPYTRSRYYHLYINGQYWGLYQTQERAEADFAATYFGGTGDDYDVVKVDPYYTSSTDGDMEAWTRFWNTCKTEDLSSIAVYNRLQGLNPDGTRNPAYEVQLDVDNLVDYMISTLYTGDRDGPISSFLGNTNPNNFFAIRNRNGQEGWKFFRHDGEHTLNRGDEDRTGPWQAGDGLSESNPQWFHQQLCFSAEYRMRFADRVYKYLFNDGVLTAENATAGILSRAAEIDEAIIAESARWGDAKTGGGAPRNKNDWVTAVGEIVNSWIPNRSDIFLAQLRNYNSMLDKTGQPLPLYPTTVAPTFNQHGGDIPSGFLLTISAPAGPIYYTIDGTDPRLPGGALSGAALLYEPGVTVLALTGNTHVKARALVGGVWSALDEAVFVLDTPPDVRVTEIMYNPADPDTSPGSPELPYTDNDEFEYLEIQNFGPSTVNLAGVTISNGVEFTFPTWYLAPGDYVLVVRNPDAFNARYPGLGSLVAGEFDLGFGLANNGERLTLSTVTGHTIQTFEYQDGWFPQTDGKGFSLVIRDPAQDLALWDAKDGWRASWLASGNPGAADTGINPGSVVINEIMSHQDIAEGDWIELHNTSASPVPIGGWYLSDDPHDLMKYRIAPGTTIAGGGYLVLTYRDNFGPTAPDAGRLTGFGFSEYGDDAYLTGSPAEGVLGGYREDEYFGAADNGVVFGRYTKSTGGKDFVSLVSPTPWDANAAPVVGPIVIHEIMYNPPVGGYEYIELYNPTDAAVDLHDGESPQNTWRIAGAVTFTFPEGASIAAHGYALVVGIDPAVFRATYGVPGSVAIYGPYTGVLDNAGETIELYRPGVPDPGVVPQVLVEKVTYGDADPWPTQPDGDGSSLNRLLPGAYGHYGNDVANWQASTSGGSPGAANVPIDATPPSTPADLEAAAASETAIDLAWAAAFDPDTGLFGYRIYRDGAAVGTSTTTLFTDYGVVAGVVYTYQVSALNGDKVEGARSSAVTASLLTVTSIATPDQTHVKITFNAPVDEASAETTANYKLIHGAGIGHTIASASLDAGGTVVTLTLSTPLTSGEVHALAVKGVLAQSGAAVAPGCQRTFRYWAAGTGTILRQWWLGIDGNEVSLLTGNPNYPNNPSGSDYPTSFETPIDWAESYGTRMQGYVHPSESGYYTFWIASDDNSQLWLSTDENPAHKQMVAYVASWASSRQWMWYPSQQSAAIYLEAGQRYYVEALQKEGGGGDNLAVAWWFNYAGQPLDTLTPIPGAYLSPYTGAATAVTVNVVATDAEAAEEGSNPGTFTIARTNTANTLVVYYTVTGRAAAGDYTPAMTNWVLMNVGVASVPIYITPVDDSTPERDETVVLTLTASPRYSVGVGSATITILDNDQVTPPTVSLVATDAAAAEAGQNPGTFTVSRVGDTTAALTVHYSVGGTAGTEDYSPVLAGSVVIEAGATSAPIVITPVDDDDDEPDETVTLTLLADAEYAIGTSSDTVTITDDDLPTVSLVATDPAAAEAGQDPGTFTVSRVGDTSEALTVYYTIGGTAGTGDYSPVLTGSVVIEAGASSVPIVITPADDGENEPDETVTLTLTADAEYAIGAGSDTVTIIDNEVPQVTAVLYNRRTGRTVSSIEPSGLGVRYLDITFDEAVTFAAGDVAVQKVTFDGDTEILGALVTPASVTGSGTAVMTLEFTNGSVVDTWVKVTLGGGVTDVYGHALDGEAKAGGSGRGYIYKDTLDLPTGDGTPGGDAVFYVGGLRGDMRGAGFTGFLPDGKVDVWDINGFTSKYTAGNLDADMRGAGFTGFLPDGLVNVWDINGFTSYYSAAVSGGKHLDALPTVLGGPLASGLPSPLAPLTAEPSGAAASAFASSARAAPADVTAPADVAAPSDASAPAGVQATGLTVASEDAWSEDASVVWSPAAGTAEEVLDADAGVVDLLKLPALGLPLGV